MDPFEDCFLRDKSKCGLSLLLSEENGTFQLNQLDRDITTHFKKLAITPPEGWTEFHVIRNRAAVDPCSVDDAHKICPRHCASLGKYYKPPATCKYPEHDQHIKKKRRLKVRSFNYEHSKIVSENFNIYFHVGYSI